MQREQVLESVCRASLAVRRCRTSNHCSVATKQSSDTVCAWLGAVVLAASLASLQRLCYLLLLRTRRAGAACAGFC